MNTREQGTAGEEYATQQLQKEGYEILERNWRMRRFEIDIIAQKGDLIAFVEVKLRSLGSYETPAQAVSVSQRRRIVLAAVEYLKKAGLYGLELIQPRFDVIEIVVKNKYCFELLSFHHIEHAYDLEGLGVFL